MNSSFLVVLAGAVCIVAALGEASTTNEQQQVVKGTKEPYIDMMTGKPIPPNSPYTEEQYRARDERVLKKTGGFLQLPSEGPLAMLVDARGRERATLDEVARLYTLGTKLEIDVAKEPRGTASPLATARAKMAAAKPLLLVMVVEGEAELPALSVFPEERIGIVNADRLKGGDDPTLPELRVSKEVWRAMGFIGGIGFSQAENDMMQPYYTLKEIDENDYPFIQPMNMLKMQKFWKRFGVKKAQKVPYRKAVLEGWAPTPTNNYQRAIWDEVKGKAATNGPAQAGASAQ